MTRAAYEGEIVHASCVAFQGRGLLILGPSGAGKSALALQLMALGAALVADDRTHLAARDGQLIASCPSGLSGLIEARGVGVLRADPAPPVPLALAVDLGREETERLPPLHHIALHGVPLALVLGQRGGHFPFAILQYLRSGRQA